MDDRVPHTGYGFCPGILPLVLPRTRERNTDRYRGEMIGILEFYPEFLTTWETIHFLASFYFLIFIFCSVRLTVDFLIGVHCRYGVSIYVKRACKLNAVLRNTII